MERRSIQPTSKSLLQLKLNKETTGFRAGHDTSFSKRSPLAGTMDQVRPQPIQWPLRPRERRLVDLSSSNPIRWRPLRRPRTEARPRRTVRCKKGLTFEGPLQKDGL